MPGVVVDKNKYVDGFIDTRNQNNYNLLHSLTCLDLDWSLLRPVLVLLPVSSPRAVALQIMETSKTGCDWN